MGVTGICKDKVCEHSNKEDWDNVIVIHSKVGGSGAESPTLQVLAALKILASSLNWEIWQENYLISEGFALVSIMGPTDARGMVMR